MPAAVVAIVAVASSVAAAVVAVAATIAAALAGIAAAVGSVISAIGSVIFSTIGKLVTGVYGIVRAISAGVAAPVIEAVANIADTIGPLVTNLAQGLAQAIQGITLPIYKTIKVIKNIGLDFTAKLYTVIDGPATMILTPIKAGLEVIYSAVQAVANMVTTAFHPSARFTELQKAHPEMWELAEHNPTLFIQDLQSAAIISSTEASLLVLPDVINIIKQASTVKLLVDLIKGQGDMTKLIGQVAEGKSVETAIAIAQLSKGIITSTVGVMDYVDSNVNILRAGIDNFDERLKTSLADEIAITKAELLAAVTPKMMTLGTNQQKVLSGIARISRHIEDESWFAAMLIRLLR